MRQHFQGAFFAQNVNLSCTELTKFKKGDRIETNRQEGEKLKEEGKMSKKEFFDKFYDDLFSFLFKVVAVTGFIVGVLIHVYSLVVKKFKVKEMKGGQNE